MEPALDIRRIGNDEENLEWRKNKSFEIEDVDQGSILHKKIKGKKYVLSFSHLWITPLKSLYFIL